MRVWLGPLLAAAFMLKGMGVLMPAAIVLVVELLRRKESRPPVRPWLVAAALFAIPVGAWAVARWQVDGTAFFKVLFGYDFIARTVGVIEEHPGSWLYYLDVLQRNHYDWLIAGIAAIVLVPGPRRWIVEQLRLWRRDDRVLICGTWMGLTLLIPTVMQTKLPWYLNEFYPVFAIATACLIVRGLTRVPMPSAPQGRQIALAAVVVMAAAVAEGKLIWYSFEHRDLAHSVQGLILGERDQLIGQRVFRQHWDRAETFVLSELVGAEQHDAPTLDVFMTESCAGDYLLASAALDLPELELIREGDTERLYRRRE
jgi:4-amino-4-deoxy-L-arabinose transferase-like glycosyltransferase